MVLEEHIIEGWQVALTTQFIRSEVDQEQWAVSYMDATTMTSSYFARQVFWVVSTNINILSYSHLNEKSIKYNTKFVGSFSANRRGFEAGLRSRSVGSSQERFMRSHKTGEWDFARNEECMYHISLWIRVILGFILHNYRAERSGVFLPIFVVLTRLRWK